MSVTRQLSLMRFRPYYKSVMWGGSRLAEYKNEPIDIERVGESWEISDLDGAQSVVEACADDRLPLTGRHLGEIVEIHGRELLGDKQYRIHGAHFPLLVKFIDAAGDLSIQVHPDDSMAARLYGSKGKTELWYTIDAAPGAFIYSGLRTSTGAEQLRSHIADGSFCDLLAKFYPRHGDIFYIPSGRIHSIGAGTFVLEIQQSSDITYRVYDYDRVDADGRPRTLHVDEAVEAIDFRVHEDYMRRFEPIVNREIVLKECPYFTVTTLNLTSSRYRLPVGRYNSPRVIVATAGSGVLTDDTGHSIGISQGHTVLAPASTRWVDIETSDKELELVTAYIQ